MRKKLVPGLIIAAVAAVVLYLLFWPVIDDMLQQVPAYFDSMDIHTYNSDISGYVQQVHGYMNAAGKPNMPLWISEWGTYRGQYTSVSFDIGVINNLIRGSRPGNDYVYGSHIFTLYDWDGFNGGFQNFVGLVGPTGGRVAGYYAFRIGARALNGCRPTYQSTASNSNLMAITTKDSAGHVYLLVTNASNTAYPVDANLSALITAGTGSMYQFDATHNDTVVGSPALSNGHVTFSLPGNSAVLIKF
jgi:hypothetical protein